MLWCVLFAVADPGGARPGALVEAAAGSERLGTVHESGSNSDTEAAGDTYSETASTDRTALDHRGHGPHGIALSIGHGRITAAADRVFDDDDEDEDFDAILSLAGDHVPAELGLGGPLEPGASAEQRCRAALQDPSEGVKVCEIEANSTFHGLYELGFRHQVEVIAPFRLGVPTTSGDRDPAMCPECKGAYVVAYETVSKEAVLAAASNMFDLLDREEDGEWDDDNVVCQLSLVGATILMFASEAEMDDPKFAALFSPEKMGGMEVQMLYENETAGPRAQVDAKARLKVLTFDAATENVTAAAADEKLHHGASKAVLKHVAYYAKRARDAAEGARAQQEGVQRWAADPSAKLAAEGADPQGVPAPITPMADNAFLAKHGLGRTPRARAMVAPSIDCFHLPNAECGHEMEEVFHVVSGGYARAYPQVFGLHEGSMLYQAALDAIGDCGQPTSQGWPQAAFHKFAYPGCSGIYHYKDPTCGMQCYLLELLNHAVLSLNGGYSYDKCMRVIGEWDACDPNLNTSQRLVEQRAPLLARLVQGRVPPQRPAGLPGKLARAPLINLDLPGHRDARTPSGRLYQNRGRKVKRVAIIVTPGAGSMVEVSEPVSLPVLDIADYQIDLPRKRRPVGAGASAPEALRADSETRS